MPAYAAALQSLCGLAVFTAAAFALSENRRAVRWSGVGIGLAVQVGLAFVLLVVPGVRGALALLNDAALALQRATQAGTGFVFGYVGGGDPPFAVTDPAGSFVLAFQALPLVLVVSALSALLFHWRVLPWIVGGLSWALRRVMRVGGAVSVGVAANVFVGMIEAPLLIRPYLLKLGRGELFVVMTAGMATIAGTVAVLYATILEPVLPGAMAHIVTASVISAPAAIAVAMIMVPETGPSTAGEVAPPRTAAGALDAITRGTMDGVTLLINIVAMLLVLVALVALVNQGLAWLPEVAGAPLTLERMLGWVLAPAAWLMGVPWAEAPAAGGLLGVKTVLNELIAYVSLAGLPEGTLSDRSRLILVYALCGFANLGSLGIMIGGMGGMAPERRDEIVALGVRSIVAGTLATLMTGCAVGVLTGVGVVSP
jgi:CNT family concentrative nucleoside transporter